MNTKTFRLSILAAIGALTMSAVAFSSGAFANDIPSPTPAASADASDTADSEILSMLSNQVEVTQTTQLVDSSTDVNISEDSQEQTAFGSDIQAALLAGDTAAVAQLTAAESFVTSVDAPEIAAVASDDAAAQGLILGLPKK